MAMVRARVRRTYSDKTSLITSSSVTGETIRNSHPGGAGEKTGGAAPAVAIEKRKS